MLTKKKFVEPIIEPVLPGTLSRYLLDTYYAHDREVQSTYCIYHIKEYTQV